MDRSEQLKKQALFEIFSLDDMGALAGAKKGKVKIIKIYKSDHIIEFSVEFQGRKYQSLVFKPFNYFFFTRFF